MWRGSISLTDAEGMKTVVRTFYKPNEKGSFDMEGNIRQFDIDRMYAILNNEDDILLIQFFVFDRIIHPVEFYFKQ